MNKYPSSEKELIKARVKKHREGKYNISTTVSASVFEAFADYRREHRLTAAAAIADLLRRAGFYS